MSTCDSEMVAAVPVANGHDVGNLPAVGAPADERESYRDRLAGLPAVRELAGLGNRFVVHDADKRPKHVRASSPRKLDMADPTDPRTWMTYADAVDAYGRLGFTRGLTGIGFVLDSGRDGIAGVDLDSCCDPETGAVADWAMKVIRDLGSYAEISPSGTGVKVFVKADPVPVLTAHKLTMGEGAKHPPAIELYATGRYFALTGDHLDDTPDEIVESTAAVERLARRIGDAAPKPAAAVGTLPQWTRGTVECDADGLPIRFLELLEKAPSVRRAWEAGGKVGKGRDTSASGLDVSLACSLARRGLNGAEIEAVLRRFAFGQIGAMATAKAATRRIERILAVAATCAPAEGEAAGGGFDLTDDGLAVEMGAGMEPYARHVHPWGRWMLWDTSRWLADEKLEHMSVTRRFLRHKGDELLAWAEEKAAELESTGEDGEAADLRKWAKGAAAGLKKARKVADVASLARSNDELAAVVGQWDADQWLLNTPGGMVDLSTGDLLSSDPLRYCTKSTAATPAPAGTDAPVWRAFLARIFRHDPELIPFVQRALGYSLTGSTREHALLFAWGEGGNGKGVLLNTALGIMGEYGQPAGLDTFLASNSDRHPTDMAGMRGSRLVVATEVSAGKSWDESKVKTLTGGDKIRARFMRQDEFTFDPQFTLWVSGNHQPAVKSADEAMRRRLMLIPFVQNIGPEERDSGLTAKLKEEWPAILRWMIDGCLAWQREGLNPPQSVLEASKEYLDREDVFGTWIEERCTRDLRAEYTPLADLYRSYGEWRAANGLQPETNRALAGRLVERGFRPVKRNTGAGFSGIKLATVDVDRDGKVASLDAARQSRPDWGRVKPGG